MDYSTVILVLFAFAAAFLQRVSGFGFGILIMTVLPYIMGSYGEATALSGLLAMVTSGIVVVQSFRSIPWRKLLPILITFVVVSWFAVLIVACQPGELIHKVLGVVLILASIWFFFFSGRVRLRPSIGVQISLGTLSGFMGGLFGMQGPPAVVYFLSASSSKAEYAALSQAYFLIGNIIMSVFRYQHGFITPSVGRAWLVAIVAVLLGGWFGSKVFERLSAESVRKVAYAYMAVSGIITLLR